MNTVCINKFLTYTLFPPKILFSIMVESEKIRKNPDYLIERKTDYNLDMIKKSLGKPIYFYNGPDHIKCCTYTENQYNDELLPYLSKRLKNHKDLKKFNEMNLNQYIESKWKRLKEFVYVNTITTVIRFDNLNSKNCMDTFIEVKKNTQPELCIDCKDLKKLKKEYKKIKN